MSSEVSLKFPEHLFPSKDSFKEWTEEEVLELENNLGDFLETIVHNLKKPKDEVVYNLCKSAWRQLDSLPVDEFLCFYESFIESERVPYFSDEFISSLRNNEVYDINSPCYITNFETNFKDKDLASILGGFVRP